MPVLSLVSFRLSLFLRVTLLYATLSLHDRDDRFRGLYIDHPGTGARPT